MRECIYFLVGHSPYDTLEVADVEVLARLVEVEYFVAGAIIVAAGTASLSHFYVVRSGGVIDFIELTAGEGLVRG